MTGFIRGLFGRNNQPSDQPSQPKEAFFLSEDDAKTYGDIDYMRSSKTIRRTFAKKKGQTEELESIKSISALGSSKVQADGTPTAPQPTFDPATTAAKADIQAEKSKRSNTDTSMDMFRNMARSMRK